MPSSIWRSVRVSTELVASSRIRIGAVLSADLLWNIADITMGLMALINIPVILFLSKYAIRAIKDYDRQRKEGKPPVFYADSIRLTHDVDYWKRENSDENA